MASAQTRTPAGSEHTAVDEDCLRLTSYFRERQRADGRPLADDLTGLYASSEVAASIVLHGTEGTSAVIAVSPRLDIEALLAQVLELASPGFVTIEQARLLTGDIEPVWLGEQPGEATMLTVHCGRQDHVYQVPAFEAVCELLYRRGVSGATVLPGTDGTLRGRRRHPQHPRFLRHDADSPLMVIAVGSGNEIGMILPELGTLFRHPVMTVQKVQVCQRDGHLVSRPQGPPADEPGGMAARLRLTVYTSEAARHDGHPVHRAAARQLGLAGAESVTTVYGIWGFYADHAPHGGHFPHRGRHVPVITTATGTPERISAAFDAVAALTAEHGLVTVQTVQAVQPAADSAQRPCQGETTEGPRAAHS
jgi:PII-like signaling protein